LNRGVCADSILICKAFGVPASKVYLGVIEDWSSAANHGTGRHPKSGV